LAQFHRSFALKNDQEDGEECTEQDLNSFYREKGNKIVQRKGHWHEDEQDERLEEFTGDGEEWANEKFDGQDEESANTFERQNQGHTRNSKQGGLVNSYSAFE